MEYAFHRSDKYNVLRALVLTFVMQVARQYSYSNVPPKAESFQQKLCNYMREHLDSVTLTEFARQFSYYNS
jgi:hypothetical protein